MWVVRREVMREREREREGVLERGEEGRKRRF